MDPANQKIFGALIRLAARLSPTQIIHGVIAAGWPHHAEIFDIADVMKNLLIAFDKENSLDEQKTRRSLCLLVEQWIVDVGKDRVQTALGESGLEFVENEFRWLERQVDPDNARHETMSSRATISARLDANLIRANRFAGSDAVSVEQVQTEHAIPARGSPAPSAHRRLHLSGCLALAGRPGRLQCFSATARARRYVTCQ